MGDVDVTLEWNPPEDDGGSPVVFYNLELCLDGKTWKPVKNDIAECEFNVELEEDKVYRFRVTAKSDVGLGKPSPVSDPISLRKYSTSETFLQRVQSTKYWGVAGREHKKNHSCG